MTKTFTTNLSLLGSILEYYQKEKQKLIKDSYRYGLWILACILVLSFMQNLPSQLRMLVFLCSIVVFILCIHTFVSKLYPKCSFLNKQIEAAKKLLNKPLTLAITKNGTVYFQQEGKVLQSLDSLTHFSYESKQVGAFQNARYNLPSLTLAGKSKGEDIRFTHASIFEDYKIVLASLQYAQKRCAYRYFQNFEITNFTLDTSQPMEDTKFLLSLQPYSKKTTLLSPKGVFELPCEYTSIQNQNYLCVYTSKTELPTSSTQLYVEAYGEIMRLLKQSYIAAFKDSIKGIVINPQSDAIVISL